jgi:tetratricopeptide (TPR) repeat protein
VHRLPYAARNVKPARIDAIRMGNVHAVPCGETRSVCRVGESLATMEKHSTPLAEATTPSVEALKAYSTGMKMALSSGNEAAIPFFRRAVEIDPKFAMAYANLGLSYSAIGESVLSAESTTKAWHLSDLVSDREKFFIDFSYDRQVTGNLEKAYQTIELWSQAYPRRGGNVNPQDLLGAYPPMGPADLKKRLQQRMKQSRRIPILRWRMEVLRRPISALTISPKRRARFSAPRSSSWNYPLFWFSDTTSRW